MRWEERKHRLPSNEAAGVSCSRHGVSRKKEKEKNKKQQKNCCQKRKVIDFSVQK